MREDLDHQKNLKLEVATYFGKPRTFFDCLSTPGSEGHTRIYQFIKRLYTQLESLRVINAMPSTTSTANSGVGQQSTSPGIGGKRSKVAGSGVGGGASARGRALAPGNEGGTGGIR